MIGRFPPRRDHCLMDDRRFALAQRFGPAAIAPANGSCRRLLLLCTNAAAPRRFPVAAQRKGAGSPPDETELQARTDDGGEG